MDDFTRAVIAIIRRMGKAAKYFQTETSILENTTKIKSMAKAPSFGLAFANRQVLSLSIRKYNNMKECGGEGFQMVKASMKNQMVLL